MKDHLHPLVVSANTRTPIREKQHETEDTLGVHSLHPLLTNSDNILMLQRVIGNQAVQRQLQQDPGNRFRPRAGRVITGTASAALIRLRLAAQKRQLQSGFVVDSKTLEAIKKNSKGDKECAAIAQENVKGIGLTSEWKAGVHLMTFPNIPKGTVIATFDKDGKYPNKRHGNHVAIFLEYVKDKGGKIVGIIVLDQWKERKAGERTMMFISEQEMQKYLKDHPPSRHQASLNSNAANNMYVVEKANATPK
jgi:hypothetical protein